MNSEMVWAFGDLLDSGIAGIYDKIGNVFNFIVVAAGFLGFIYWMMRQAKYNKEAEANSDQIK